MNYEYAELNRKTGTSFDTVIRYQKARKALLQRADTMKGKDEARRKSLLKSAERMRVKGPVATRRISMLARIAEIDLQLDDIKHRGKSSAKK